MLDRARLEDGEEIEELLRSVGLPADDVAGEGLFAHWVWRRDGRVVATVGLDIVGSEAVLRSLATHADCRGQRIASALCDAAEEEARRQSVAAIYLLTEATQSFAEHRGYHASLGSGECRQPPQVPHGVLWLCVGYGEAPMTSL